MVNQIKCLSKVKEDSEYRFTFVDCLAPLLTVEIAFIVLRPGKNPNWLFVRQIKCEDLRIARAIPFSNHLPNHESKEIGPKSGSQTGLTIFGIGVMCAPFHCVLCWLFLMQALKRRTTTSTISSRHEISNLADSWSGPTELGLRLLRSFSTAVMVKSGDGGLEGRMKYEMSGCFAPPQMS